MPDKRCLVHGEDCLHCGEACANEIIIWHKEMIAKDAALVKALDALENLTREYSCNCVPEKKMSGITYHAIKCEQCMGREAIAELRKVLG